MIGGRGMVAHLQGNLAIRTGVNRSDGFRRVMGRYPEIQIAYEAQGTDWSYAAGRRLMGEALVAQPQISGVFAASDAMALAALDTVEAAGRAGQVSVVGFDGQPDGLAAIYAGRLGATVDQPSYSIGRAAADAARGLLRGERVAPEITIASRLITSENLLDAAIQTVQIMPGLFQSLLENAERQRQLQEQVISAQRQLIQDLSAPILPLADDVIALPLIGAIDSLRAGQITELLLTTIIQTRARAVIVDISGVPVVDTSVANHLLQTASAARLLGTSMILVGISPEIAQTMVQIGIDLSSIRTCSTMREGLAFAQAMDSRGRIQAK
jgi:anti-anti-sigma factor